MLKPLRLQPARVLLTFGVAALVIALGSMNPSRAHAADSTTVTTIATTHGNVSKVVLSHDGSKLYAMGYNGTTDIIDTASRQITGTMSTPNSIYMALAPGSSSRAYFTNWNAGELVPVDTLTDTPLTPISLPHTDVWGLAVTPNGSKVVVNSHNGSAIEIVNVATSAVTSVPVGANDRVMDLAITPNGRYAFVTDTQSSTLHVLDLSTNTLVPGGVTLPSSGRRIVMNDQGTIAYVSTIENYIYVINVATKSVLRTITLPNASGVIALALSNDGKRLYTVEGSSGVAYVISTSDDRVLKTVALPTGTSSEDVALSSDSKRLYVARQFNQPGITIVDFGSVPGEESLANTGLNQSILWIGLSAVLLGTAINVVRRKKKQPQAACRE